MRLKCFSSGWQAVLLTFWAVSCGSQIGLQSYTLYTVARLWEICGSLGSHGSQFGKCCFKEIIMTVQAQFSGLHLLALFCEWGPRCSYCRPQAEITTQHNAKQAGHRMRFSSSDIGMIQCLKRRHSSYRGEQQASIPRMVWILDVCYLENESPCTSYIYHYGKLYFRKVMWFQESVLHASLWKIQTVENGSLISKWLTVFKNIYTHTLKFSLSRNVA